MSAADHTTALLAALLHDAKRARASIGETPITAAMCAGEFAPALVLALSLPSDSLDLRAFSAALLKENRAELSERLSDDIITRGTVSPENAGHHARELVREHADALRRDAGERLAKNPNDGRARELLAKADLLDAASDGTAKTGPVILRMADVPREKIRWLWRHRLAMGKLCVLAGDPGGGKTHVALDIAARVTTGAAWPDGGHAVKGDVLLMSAEDDPADTLRPRLEAAGADLERVHVLEGRRVAGQALPEVVTLQSLDTIRSALHRLPDCRLLIVDPVSAYYGRVDSNNTAEVRALMAPLQDLCARRGVALLVIAHPNKATGQRAMYRVSGALGLTAAARVAWLVAEDDEQPGRRTFTAIKSNIGPTESGLAFSLEPWPVDPDYRQVAWEREAVMLTADDVLNPPEKDRQTARELDRLLVQELAAGPVEVKSIRATLEQAGFPVRTVKRAKKRLGIVSEKRRGNLTGRWVWTLPKAGDHPKDLYCTSSAPFETSSKNTEEGRTSSKRAEAGQVQHV